jgi:hypothetical protein
VKSSYGDRLEIINQQIREAEAWLAELRSRRTAALESERARLNQHTRAGWRGDAAQS